MGFKSDIEIAQEAKPQDIREIAKKLGLTEDDLELYGKYKAKIDYNLLKKDNGKKKAKLILTTAINPTPAGEGKTTTTIGVADGLQKLGKNVLVALRAVSYTHLHLARMMVGSDNIKVLPVSLILGSIFLVSIDTLSRVMTSAELPLGILTGLILSLIHI